MDESIHTTDGPPTAGGICRVQTADWGWVNIPSDSVEDLATFTGMSREECLRRLHAYTSKEMGEAWQTADPRTPEAMRRFYSTMDLYLWDLTQWHASESYRRYLRALDNLATLQGPGRRMLDYGSGIGTAAVELAKRGYDITIADVPGSTFEYAQHRLRRRGIPFKAIEITTEYPALPERLDALVCFDVLEHVPAPDLVFKHLMRHMAPGAVIALEASVDAQAETAPYHLRENYLRWGGGRWALFMSGAGYVWAGDLLYRRQTGLPRLARKLNYSAWRLTGFDIRYKSRRIRG